MFIHHTGSHIKFEADSKSHFFDQCKIWFKGYFFYNDKFYQHTIAVDFLYKAYLDNRIEDIMPDLNGIFTCVIINEKTNCVNIYNDRFGFSFLFYIANENNLFISDNFWKLSEKGDKKEINLQSAYELMNFHYVLAENTLIDGIKEILPSSIYKFESPDKKPYITRKEYWQFRYKPDLTNKADQKIYNTLNNIIQRYKKLAFDNSDIAINLTGGYDSRFLLALLLKNEIRPENISAYTYGPENCEDIRISTLIAKKIGIKHQIASFDNFIDSFFNEKKINENLIELGFRAYYLQGFGVKLLEPLYHNTKFLLTGADGFFVGLYTNKVLFNISSRQELVNYIFKKNLTFISAGECNYTLKNPISNLENLLKKRINETLPNDEDYISSFYDWTIKNRLRKLIVGLHEILNKQNMALYPFYDYEYLDLMASLSYDELFRQKSYYNALFKFALNKDLTELRDYPVDFREKAILKNNNWILPKRIKENFFHKVIRKLFNLPQKNLTYPTFELFRFNRNLFLSKIKPLLYKDSQLLDPAKVLSLLKRKKRNNNFFAFGLPNFISVFAFEKLINDKAKES